jgi:hypothetical protein
MGKILFFLNEQKVICSSNVVAPFGNPDCLDNYDMLEEERIMSGNF